MYLCDKVMLIHQTSFFNFFSEIKVFVKLGELSAWYRPL